MYAIYRPSERVEIGSAFQFYCRAPDVFIHATKQKGPKLQPGVKGQQFDWEKQIIFKMGVIEMGKLLGFLRKRLPKVELFHRSENAQYGKQATTLGIEPGKERTYKIRLARTRKINDQDETQVVGLYFDEADATVLEEFFSGATRMSLGFGNERERL